ncbi:MAG: pyridoxamine 5'-phosphate oxidase family protein [Piscirickettsiaceae bacterium]|nr:pyridoxamine 5'-phosphate oxidase family protein [Piscirickettsiaceae bacterium]
MSNSSFPYHEGELAVQQLANESEMARMNGAVVSNTIIGGALRFIEQQSMAVIGSVSEDGSIWSSVLFGPPGFVRALDDHTLEIDLLQSPSAQDDPLWTNLNTNPNVGILLIELSSRRRIRINGQARKVSANRYIIDVERSYPNCPKYIQRRQLKTFVANEYFPNSQPSTKGKIINEKQKSLIAKSDTLFVASAHPEHGVDSSHRGGHPGFVQLIDNHTLRIPDFSGNSMFNTLGNFVSYPYAGLVFIDFERGGVLQLSGQVEILWDLDDPNDETGGTQRYWQFKISAWQECTIPTDLDWEFMDSSPFIPKQLRTLPNDGKLLLKIGHIQSETDQIKSFRLFSANNEPLPEFEPGSHIQVKVKLPDGSDVDRHYSLLSDPNNRAFYEIAVLAEPHGRGGSLYFHKSVQEGDMIESKPPKNEFPMVNNSCHNILIAGGIGITPILSMLHKLASNQQSFEMHYSARTKAKLAFRNRIESLAGDRVNFYAADKSNGQRLDLDRLLSTPKPNVHVYVCGPRRLISAVRDIATSRGWPSTQIHFESFGAPTLVTDLPLQVHLAKSKMIVTVPADRSILDTLLDAGVSVPHECKRGECSMCATKVLAGEPDHRDLCLSQEDRMTSMCVCVSRAQGEELQLDL